MQKVNFVEILHHQIEYNEISKGIDEDISGKQYDL
jgi:hypothetical protein